ncbi:hypothetical protein D3C76_1079570 [compost metagenome]
MVRQTEGQLERTLGNALIQISDVFVRVAFTATDGQHTFLDFELQIFFLETGRGNHDAVLIVAVFLHVIGWIAAAWLVAQGGLEQVVETVETYRGTEQWGQGKSSTHDSNLLKTISKVFCLRDPNSASRNP